MRLHRVELTAFGPYVGKETVDFDALGADGLFLLHGDTGAGKTTVLDAVSFALFGTVPGARGQAKRLRCDLADPDVATEVVLELTVQGRRIRIARSPEYLRPKRRGDGVTKQNAKASLTWLDEAPEGQPAGGLTRIDEVGLTAQRLIGMTAEQFFQVVLLPQGEFARFLRAETSERERLLEKLFATQRFDAAQEWLSARRKTRRAELDLRRQNRREWVARFEQAAGDEFDESDVEVWARKLTERAVVNAEAAQKGEARAREASRAADAILTERRAHMDRVKRVRQAHEQLAVLAERAPQLDARKAEVAAARRAEGVVAGHTAAERLHLDADEAESVTSRAETVLADALVVLGVTKNTATDPKKLRGKASQFHHEAGQLAGLIAESEQQESDTRHLSTLRNQCADLEAETKKLQTRLDELPEEIKQARSALDDANSAAVRVDNARAEVERLESLLADARAFPTAVQDAERVKKAESVAVDAHQQARETLQDLRERRLAGMAAELAGTLAESASCPVCGSAEHPAPATPLDDAVTDADEAHAATAEAAALQARQQAATARQEADALVKALRERLGDRHEHALQTELESARTEAAALASRVDQQEALARTLRDLEERQARLATSKQDAERAVANAQAEINAIEQRMAERDERLDEARGDHESVAARRDALIAAAEAYEELATARAALATARQQLADQQELVDRAVEEAGFGSLAKALEAARDVEVIAAMEAELRQSEVDERAARAALADPELDGIDPADTVDVAAAIDEAAAAREAADTALVEVERAARTAQQLEDLRRKLGELTAALAPAEAEFAELDALTDVFNGRGQNHRKMSLRSYVLAARLEEVAHAATARLRVMSQGRYAFVHSDAAGARGTRGGLGLDVLDDYSGQVRSAKTLSGGESFLASLALALGLADVVTAESGGTSLDTLFIDEGFGALDAESLDVVMDTLDGLRAGGRVVGVVSHVEEMRQRIPSRLHVRKDRAGSTLEVAS